MNMKFVIFHAFFAVAWTLVYLAGALLMKNPEINYTVFGLIVFLLVGRRKYGDKTGFIMFSLCAVSALPLYFPLKSISLPLLLVFLVVLAALYVFSRPFSSYMRAVEKHEKDLAGRAEALSRLNSVGISKLECQNEELEREIREISSIYTAVKELTTTMTLDSAMNVISEILKKIIKNNFKISLDDISFIMIFKREYDYYIAHSFGFDEDVLKSGEKQVVASILRNVSKNDQVYYLPKITDSGSVGGMSFLKSVVYLPFYAEKKMLGVILISGVKENIFSENQIDSLRLLSNQIAITMEKVYLYEEVQQMSVKDGLTGLVVHRHFQEKLELELKRTARYGGNLSVVMADIDFFKKINDTYGHLAGDFILKTIALILKNHTAATDIVARYGGEEFVIVFPETDKDVAHMKAVKIRKDIESYNFVFNGQQIKVTMSMGVSGYPGDAITRRTLIEKADKALYKAKEEGRNRVIKAS